MKPIKMADWKAVLVLVLVVAAKWLLVLAIEVVKCALVPW